MKAIIKIGTRGSQLALYQAELVKTKIEAEFPLVQVEIIKIKTSGDMIRRSGTHPMETKRIYTKEIEEALLHRDVDIAVHSAKDMAVILPDGLKLSAALEREDARDCLISKDHKKLSELGIGARIGTSSLRRKKQLLRYHTEIIVQEMHGNVDSRIRKMSEGEYDAIVLAYAGIKRLGYTQYVSEIFPEEQFYPAPGQGIIVIQSRSGDSEVDEILGPLNHAETAKRLLCERAFLRRLEGGCQLPCGITSEISRGALQVKGALFDVESHDFIEAEHSGSDQSAESVGVELAEKILADGGQKILDALRHVS